ncbi:RNase A-like domain-containing protein [Streptomyces sp. NPDC004752]
MAWDVLAQDFVDCWHGSVGGCAWAASNFLPGKKIAEAVDALRAFDAALRTGIGVEDAFKALKSLNVDAATLADVERSYNVYEDLVTSCRVNSFPNGTLVLMADGTTKNIADIRPGDLVAAGDGDNEAGAQPVTRTFHHDTDHLADIRLDNGEQVSTTVGHRFYVVGRGWTLAADLQAGYLLRAQDGTTQAVVVLNDRDGLAGQQVYDLSIGGPHTFYVLAGSTPVLVHNCNDLVADNAAFPGLAHVLDEHVNVTRARALELAADKGINGVFTDLQTAQQVVDYALANKAGEITKWLRTKDVGQQKVLTGTFGAANPLGWVAHADGSIADAKNSYTVILKRAKGHRYGYYVCTAYPS